VTPELSYRPNGSGNETDGKAADRAVDAKDRGGGNHPVVRTGIRYGADTSPDRGPTKCTKEAANDRMSDMVYDVNAGRCRVIPWSGCYDVNRIGANTDTICFDPYISDRP
jgi:hypothetical protein